MTETRRVYRLIAPWVALSLVLIIALGGCVIGLIAQSAANQAGKHADKTATCVNDALGTRAQPAPAPGGGPGTTDAQAHIDFAKMIQKAFNQKPSTDPKVQQQRLGEFLNGVNNYVAVLVTNQAYRDQHPLGKC